MKSFYEVILISIIFFAVCFIYKGQPRISLENGKGWDGKAYYSMTEQIQQGIFPVNGPKPFIKRIGNFYLVANYAKISGLDIMESALHINLIGMFVTVILLVLWLKIYIRWLWIRVLLVTLFMTAWFVPLRFSFYLPMSSDAWGAVWLIAGFLLLNRIKILYNEKRPIFITTLIFSIIVAIGSLFRESNAVLAIAIFFIVNPFKFSKFTVENISFLKFKNFVLKFLKIYLNKSSLIFALPIVFTLVFNLIISNYLIHVTSGSYNGYFWAVMTWFYIKSLPEFLLGVCHAYGPLLLLVPVFHKEFMSFFKNRQDLLFLLLVSFFFGYIGGADTERILFMSSFPIVLLLIGLSIRKVFESNQKWWFFVLLLFQTISYRIYWFTPNFPSLSSNKPIPFFGLIGENFQYLYLYAQHGHVYINAILFLEYLFLFIATIYVMSIRKDHKVISH